MLKLIGFLIKASLFTILILVLGNAIEWNGKTISDQVKTHLAQAQRWDVSDKVKSWSGNLVDDAKKGATRKPQRENTDIPHSEREKLRDLIRELNR